ncbi:hypothetical protein KO498_05115 [Lentibacter algarum]|uniref:hypothetical protein n=1 Tax=Lentibacter algarum TaxID=576131 RepID=UPI001C066AB8|nr:hypothetical protein [Lentibacter algarum]MBU2981186.1 hypothetical protein [Lentibacter algarum]
MSIAHLLETFDHAALPGGATDAMLESRADKELAVYERAYTAGWDDCTKAALDAAGDAEGDFKNNLRELSFTYQEAYSAITKSLEPLFQQLVDVSLPQIAQDSLGLKLKEQVMELARTHAASTLEVVCHPSQEARLAAILDQDTAMPTRITSDTAFSEGQLTMRFADEERQIDIERLSASMKAAVDEFFNELKKEPRNV